MCVGHEDQVIFYEEQILGNYSTMLARFPYGCYAYFNKSYKTPKRLIETQENGYNETYQKYLVFWLEWVK